MNLIGLLKRYKDLGINAVIDHNTFNLISVIHHSTRIERRRLTALETQTIFHDGLTSNGKPITNSIMIMDYYEALQFVIQKTQPKKSITINPIQKINALVLKYTGFIYNTILGLVNTKTGAYKKENNTTGASFFLTMTKRKRTRHK